MGGLLIILGNLCAFLRCIVPFLSMKKPPPGPLAEDMSECRARVCNILAVNGSGDSMASAICEIPNRDPSRVSMHIWMAALIAYSQLLENIMLLKYQNFAIYPPVLSPWGKVYCSLSECVETGHPEILSVWHTKPDRYCRHPPAGYNCQ